MTPLIEISPDKVKSLIPAEGQITHVVASTGKKILLSSTLSGFNVVFDGNKNWGDYDGITSDRLNVDGYQYITVSQDETGAAAEESA